MEENFNIFNYNFTKKERGKFVASIIDTALSSPFLANYKLAKGCKIKFRKSTSEHNNFSYTNMENKTINLSNDFFTKKERFANDIYSLLYEIKHLAQFSGKYTDKHPVDKISPIFENTLDISQMVTREKCGISDKNIMEYPNEKQELIKQVRLDLEVYMAGKCFTSPRERDCRNFSKKIINQLLAKYPSQSLTKEQEELFNALKTFLSHKNLQDIKQEEFVENYIKSVEIEVLKTLTQAQQNTAKTIENLSNDYSSIESFRLSKGFNPIKAVEQSLSISYNDSIAKNLFKKCLMLEGNEKENINSAINLIKYTDFYPSQSEIHLLNEVSKNYNMTMEKESEKIYPKRVLKAFYNVESEKSVMQNVEEMAK